MILKLVSSTLALFFLGQGTVGADTCVTPKQVACHYDQPGQVSAEVILKRLDETCGENPHQYSVETYVIIQLPDRIREYRYTGPVIFSHVGNFVKYESPITRTGELPRFSLMTRYRPNEGFLRIHDTLMGFQFDKIDNMSCGIVEFR